MLQEQSILALWSSKLTLVDHKTMANGRAEQWPLLLFCPKKYRPGLPNTALARCAQNSATKACGHIVGGQIEQPYCIYLAAQTPVLFHHS